MRTSRPAPPSDPGPAGALIPVNGYYAGLAFLAGTPYGSEASGIRLATAGEFANPDAYVLTERLGANRYPIVAGTDPAGTALTAAEVRAILEEAFKVMSAARAQIRRPLDSRAQVTISVVDTNGRVLGIVRSPDAPIFGTDVSLQKARTAAFFSSATAGAELAGNLTSADVRAYVPAARAFFNDPTALTGRFAFSDRAIGNVSRPYFPDGELGRPPGAFSRPVAEFNPLLDRPAIGADRGEHRPARDVRPGPHPRRHAGDLHRRNPNPASGSPTASRSSPARCRSIAATPWSAASACRATASTRTT